jgi:diacylglycerol kinase (ATP)
MTRRIAILVNPPSGRGRAVGAGEELRDRLTTSGLESVLLQGGSADESRELVRRAVADEVDALVVCGGDGTVHLALQQLVGTSVALGIVPVGSGDDIARALGLPRGEVATTAEAVIADRRRLIDVAEAVPDDGQRRWFLGVMSAGFDSMVNERANRMSFPPGQAKYLAAIVAELGVFHPVAYRLELDGVPEEADGMLVAVGNAVSYGGGMKVCPSAVIDDGELSVMFLGKVSKPTFLRVFPRVFTGTHVTHPAVTERSARTVRIEGPGQIAYADGERIAPLPVTVTVSPLALSVFA